MKILFVRANQGIPDSRVEKEIYSLSKEHEVELLGWDRTRNNNGLIKKVVNISGKEIQFYHIAIEAPQGEGFKKILVPMIRFWIEVRKFIIQNSNRYDVIHFCDFDTAALASCKTKRLGIKVVYDIFDYYSDSHNAPRIIKNVIRGMENYIIEHSDAVILCSEARVEQIRPAVPRKLVIIHNSPSEEILKEEIEMGGNKNNKRLVYVGMLSEERYLREIAKVVAGRQDIEWHIGGFGVLESYFFELSQKYTNVYFYGKLKYSQTLYLESECDIMTAIYDPSIPNHKYAAPNKFYEALLLEKELIVARDTGIDDVVENEEVGIVINAYSKEEFIKSFDKALEELLERKDKDTLQETKQSRLYNTYYSWNVMEERLLKLYTEI